MVVYVVREDIWVWIWFSHPWRQIVDSFRVAFPSAQWYADRRAWRMSSKQWAQLNNYAQSKGYRLVVVDRRQQMRMF